MAGSVGEVAGDTAAGAVASVDADDEEQELQTEDDMDRTP